MSDVGKGLERLPAKWLASIRVDERYGCWRWTGSKTHNGYGRVNEGNSSVVAHKAVYELLHGPVPEGRAIDHGCRRRDCVNPAHLEPVSTSVNLRRRRLAGRVRELCKAGHNMFVNGQVTPEGGETCRVCSGVSTQPRGRISAGGSPLRRGVGSQRVGVRGVDPRK